MTGRVRVAGAKVDDWEDIAVGPCPEGSCIYIADIGDNSGSRDRITIYRVGEPAPDEATSRRVEIFHAAYPDGAHDAEALFVTPESEGFIITKGDPGPIALYRFAQVEGRDRPTAADVSPDGAWVAVRTTGWVAFHRTSDLTRGEGGFSGPGTFARLQGTLPR